MSQKRVVRQGPGRANLSRALTYVTASWLGVLALLAACSGKTSDDPVASAGAAGASGSAPDTGSAGSALAGSANTGNAGASTTGGTSAGIGGTGPSAGGMASGGAGGAGPVGSGEPCSPSGASAKTADGCNDCTCSQGTWSCTHRTCTAKACGGFAGSTCSAEEYCAYTAGQYCGAADASATCQPRPQACNDIYMPVCGCDGKNYSSTCVAASNGTGVNSTGDCPQ